MSTDKYKIGDVVKYTYDPGEPESGWFLAKIAEIQDNGYVANLVSKGWNTPYETDTFNGIHLGQDSANLEPHVSAERVEFPELIGPAPKPVLSPDFVAPFSTEDTASVKDANGDTLVFVDSTPYYDDDRKIAQVIAAALNAYFEEK